MASLQEVILKGNDASKPGSAPPGSLYFATDTQKVYRFNGSSWDDVTPGGASGGSSLIGVVTPATLTPPTIGSFSWFNQGSMTASTNSAGALWLSDSVADIEQLGGLKKPTPGSTWSAVLGCVPMYLNSRTSGPKIIVGENSSGKYCDFGLQLFGHQWYWQAFTWTNTTTRVTSIISVPEELVVPIAWLKLVNDGANLVLYGSPDGQNWVQQVSFAWGGFMTSIDTVGFGMYHTDGGFLAIHWSLS